MLYKLFLLIVYGYNSEDQRRHIEKKRRDRNARMMIRRYQTKGIDDIMHHD